MTSPSELEVLTIKAYLIDALPKGTEVTEVFYRLSPWDDNLFVRIKFKEKRYVAEVLWNLYPEKAMDDPLYWPKILDLMITKFYKDIYDSSKPIPD